MSWPRCGWARLEPSEYDVEMTAKVVAGARLLDLEMVDHVIYTARGYASLREVVPVVFFWGE